VELTTAVAAAIGESGGNTDAVGDGGHSHGLWQIYLPAHPQYSEAAMHDPVANANAAYAIYVAAGRSFEPFHAWSHANAAKKAALYAPAVLGVQSWMVSHPGAVLGAAVASTPAGQAAGQAAGGIAGAAKGAASGLEGVSQSLEKVRAWVTTPANIGRLSLGIVAGVVILIGAATLLAKPVEETVKAVRPV
jgi:hypothetical protein